MQWLNSIGQDNHPQTSEEFPFLQKAFLSSLEQHACINGHSGWNSHYLSLKNGQGLLSSFIKDHSYGEYVFDMSWAEAYQRNGLAYYPKLLIANPFSPVQGPKIMGPNTLIDTLDGAQLTQSLIEHCHDQNLSGMHYLFCNPQEKALLQNHNWHMRHGVQFHWYNYSYDNFDHFLNNLKSRKRKSIIKERQQIRAYKISTNILTGHEIQAHHLTFFYTCYQSTYEKRGMQGYLSIDAFASLIQNMPDNIILMMAMHEEAPIACAFYFKDSENLYGRYWGSIQDIPALHFELCYYQGIEYCIKQGLKHFDPGTQGEHKISRGFEPISTYSLHHLLHEGFHDAVGDFVKEEKININEYKNACYERLPFNLQNQPEPK